MPTIQIDAQLTAEKLLQAVEQLSPDELAGFVTEVLALQAQRREPHLPQAEADLLAQINRSLPLDIQKRFDELMAKRQSETLTPHEHEELLDLTDEIEGHQAQRVGYLADLARLRQLSLDALIAQLGIQPPTYA
jgi:predicted DNA-binding transcriptional regulator YafY